MNETIVLNTNSNVKECNTEVKELDCLVNFNSQMDFYIKLLAVVFYTTATLNLFLKIISLFNFKYWLMHRLLFKTKKSEDDLYRQYNESKSRLFRRQLESRIAENEKYWAENFLDIDLYGAGGGDVGNEKPPPLPLSNPPNAESNRYLNLEMENFLGDEERKAIEMIDDALQKPTASTNQHLETTNINTFKTKKPNKS